MVSDILSELAIIIALLIANGVFAASELALVSARRSRLEQAAAAGDKRALRALSLAEQPDRLLATIQVGITLIGTFAAAFGGANIGDIVTEQLKRIPAIAEYAETIALVLVVLIITYLSLIIGELVPKRLALLHPDRIALMFSGLLSWMSQITRPIVWVLTRSSTLILTVLRQNREPDETVTEADILYMLRAGRAGGTVALHEERLIESVFDLNDRTAKMSMTPRTDVVAVRDTVPLADMARIALENGYSRLPVYSGNSLDTLRGSIHIKDLLPFLLDQQQMSLDAVLRPPMYVLEHETVARILSRFRREGAHIGFVVDEYGQIAGLVTLEDLLEELVGDIRDEYDTADDAKLVQRSDGSWLIDGTESIVTIAQRLKVDIEAIPEEYVTLAGYVQFQLGRVPQTGDQVPWHDWLIEVIDMDGRRVDKLLVRRAEENAPAV